MAFSKPMFEVECILHSTVANAMKTCDCSPALNRDAFHPQINQPATFTHTDYLLYIHVKENTQSAYLNNPVAKKETRR